MFGSFSKIAGGNVSPCRFVKLQTDNTVVHATASTDNIWGITQPAVHRFPLSGWDDGFAAIATEMVNIFGPGDDMCDIELVGTVTIGAYLTASTSGKAIATTTDKDQVGAIAQQAGVSGDIIKCKPVRLNLSV